MQAPDFATVRELRRAQILAEARALVAAEGLGALTIGALERRLSFTRGVITHHFRNKDEIIEALLQSVISEIDAATTARIHGCEGAEARLRAAVSGMVEGFLDRPEAVRVLIAYWGRIPHHGPTTDTNAALFRRWREASARIVQAGDFGCVPAEQVGALMVGTVLGVVAQHFFDPGALDVSATTDLACEALLARLRGG